MTCPSKEQIIQLSLILQEVAQEQRLHIICMLYSVKELCVCDIYEKLEIKQNLASHHLGVLKNLDLLHTRREGNKIYYSLNHKVFSLFQHQLSSVFNV